MRSDRPAEGLAEKAVRGELARNWRVVAASLFGLMFSAAVLPSYAIGTFVLPLQAEFGWSRPSIQAAIFFSQAGCAVAGLFVGMLADRFGVRRIALSGVLGVSASFALAAVGTGSLTTYYLAFLCLALLGGGSVPVTWCKVVTGGFERQRGFALALALTGTGIAGVAIPPLLVAINGAYGWRAGFAVLAVLPLLLALPTSLVWLPRGAALAQDAPVAPAAQVSGYLLGDALKSYRLWLIMLSIILLYLGITGILPNVIPAMTTGGMPLAQAAIVQSGYAFSLIFGRLAVGWLVDRFWAPGVAAMALMPAALGAFLLAGQPSFALALAGIGLVGIAAGAELDLLAYLTARYFGLRSFSSIYGVIYAVVAASGAAGPVAFAWLQTATDSYDVCFYVAAVLMLVGGALLLALGRYPATLPIHEAG